MTVDRKAKKNLETSRETKWRRQGPHSPSVIDGVIVFGAKGNSADRGLIRPNVELRYWH
jgi:hypothetical protein